MLKNIDTLYLSSIKSRLEEGHQTLVNPIETVLLILQDIGFASSRYWMLCENKACENKADREVLFVLSKALGEPKLDHSYGLDVPVTKCSIYKRDFDLSKKVSFEDVDVSKHSFEELKNTQAAHEVNKSLGLDHKFYVHIPILCHGELHGQLSCSYSSDTDELTETNIEGLRIIGMMLGDYKLLHSQKKLSEAVNNFSRQEKELVKKRDNRETLERITETITKLVDAEYGSAFDFNWYEARLIKVVSISAEENKFLVGDCPESYEAGKYLTGLAYANANYRYVHNVARYKERNPNLISENSYKFHLPLIDQGPLSGGCVAYGLLGQREHSSLIRVFNKSGDYRIPFDRFEIEAITQACEIFSKVYDDIITYSQLDRLQFFTERITQNFSELDKICADANACLYDEWVSELVVFGRLIADSHTTIFTNKKWNVYKKSTQGESRFIKECLGVKKISWVSLNRKKPGETEEETSLESHLRKNEFKGMLVVPNNIGNYLGGMGIPLKKEPIFTGGAPSSPSSHQANIRSYSSIISRFMAFSQNTIALGNAHDFIGSIGHEIKQPMKDIRYCIEKLEKAYRVILDQFPEAKNLIFKQSMVVNRKLVYEKLNIDDVLKQNIEMLDHVIRGNDITVEMASSIAQISGNYIELTMKPLDLRALAKNVSNNILEEADLLQGNRNIKVQFNFNKRFKDLPMVVGDPFVVEKIIENILRNAVKYSIPPGGGKPIEVDIHANPQRDSYINILISNWGVAIPNERQEEIFRPFQRGGIRDRVVAKRGMGIGLYIARIFANSHDGNVSLVKTIGTYDDPDRRQTEGWKTEFEIRLSTRLDVGTFRYDIGSNLRTKP